MEYEVLCPWAEVDPINPIAINRRVKDLNESVIGLYASFKACNVSLLNEVQRQLKERFPKAKFNQYQYCVDTAEIVNDVENRPKFHEWLGEVDTVISATGDGGSCAMYLSYNTAYIEKLGKPAVMIAMDHLVVDSRSGASSRGVPGLRLVGLDSSLMRLPHTSRELESWQVEVGRPIVDSIIDDIVATLTEPVSKKEKYPEAKSERVPRIAFKGSLEEVNRYFYKRGWSYGMPIIPPTEEAVAEMLTGTDLPADNVVAKIPPMMGKATVEKIAINAVMAGCLPTYMPILIAGVQAMVDYPKIKIEGYTCSFGSWAPLWVINGPIRQDINLNSTTAIMSPYYRPNTSIGHALGLITMNISGVRPGLEDMAPLGHEGRLGMCIAESEELSPWEPLHVFYGLNKEDSAITNFWPADRVQLDAEDAQSAMRNICEKGPHGGFDPGCAFIMFPTVAKMIAAKGLSRKDVLDYIVEYARRPADESYLFWLQGNNHLPEEIVMPVENTRTIRRYFGAEHILLVVAGDAHMPTLAAYGGGGDHGGPVTKKINLPSNWNQLVKKYKDIVPDYTRY